MPAAVSFLVKNKFNCWQTDGKAATYKSSSNAAPVPMECGVVDYRFEARYDIAKA
jgi:hypothetical protein